MDSVFAKVSRLQGIEQYQEPVDLEILKPGGYAAASMSGKLWAPNVKLPALMSQVLDDAEIDNSSDSPSLMRWAAATTNFTGLRAKNMLRRRLQLVGQIPREGAVVFDKSMSWPLCSTARAASLMDATGSL